MENKKLEELERLVSLKDRGEISEREYLQLKQEILQSHNIDRSDSPVNVGKSSARQPAAQETNHGQTEVRWWVPESVIDYLEQKTLIIDYIKSQESIGEEEAQQLVDSTSPENPRVEFHDRYSALAIAKTLISRGALVELTPAMTEYESRSAQYLSHTNPNGHSIDEHRENEVVVAEAPRLKARWKIVIVVCAIVIGATVGLQISRHNSHAVSVSNSPSTIDCTAACAQQSSQSATQSVGSEYDTGWAWAAANWSQILVGGIYIDSECAAAPNSGVSKSSDFATQVWYGCEDAMQWGEIHDGEAPPVTPPCEPSGGNSSIYGFNNELIC